MEISYDKWKTFQLANEVGVPIPASHCPESVEQVRDLVRDWQGGAVIKPRKTSGSRGMLYVDRPDQLEAAWVEVSRDYPRPMIQERVAASGEGLGVFVLIDEHDELVALFGHKRLREYPIAGGPSTLRVSHRDDALVEQSLRLLRAMNFRGVAMVEFKVDPARGEPVLMEVNPRFWGSVALAVASGVDFPLLYHRAAARIPQSPVLEFEPDIYCRWLLPGDFLNFLTNPDRMRMDPSFFRFFGPNLFYDILSLRDPAPMLGILIESLRRIMGRSS
ncbi:MAG: ATP-grasp domain-containing protein [Deltaproteobacteria bacterium]|nr:ATP-grasp domain-containing protein [Deltaproteobacteria bacterium]